MTDAPIDIPHILSKHAKWLCGDGGARANLARANLAGANLTDAYLAGANLAGANLAGANLTDANLTDAECLVDGGQRLDGYRFVGWIKDGVLMIRAGCRDLTLAEYRDHNAKRDHAALRDETTAILDHIERVATIRELLK